MEIILIIILVVVVIYFFNKKKVETASSDWGHTFDLQFSTQEFYQKVEEAVKKREVPGVAIDRVTFSEAGLLSNKREYLRVSRNEYVFDICAAPFGKSFFVSSWFGETFVNPMQNIPILKTLMGTDREHKTYYQRDTEAMFRGSIHAAVIEAVDQMTTAKGVRALSELERRPNANYVPPKSK